MQAEATHQCVFLVQAVVLDELGIEQLRTGGVFAVIAQRVAIAVEHFSGAGRAHAQARPDQGVAEAGQPPAVARGGDVIHGCVTRARPARAGRPCPVRPAGSAAIPRPGSPARTTSGPVAGDSRGAAARPGHRA
ncbi:hypothetical protein G6F24_017031 [Rhizopus arrhizus]|nr:hypothetical protein G6F24_017031 [Rhizopus arrhizus]